MSAAVTYLKNVFDGVWTALVGMRITGKYFTKKPITVQYPDECLPIPDRYRGIHYLEQEKCINCLACAKACPVDCIEMDAVRHGKELEWVKFTVDYQKCMFCELCVYPCPKDCIHMGTDFAWASFDRDDFLLDLLSYKGMSRDAKVRKVEADKKKAAKEAAKKAKAEKAAKEAAEAKKAEGGEGETKAPAPEAKAETPADQKDAKSGEDAGGAS